MEKINYAIGLAFSATLLFSACTKKAEETQRSIGNNVGGMNAAIHDTCNGPENFISTAPEYSVIFSGGDSLLWIRGRDQQETTELGIYLPWPITNGYQTDYDLYYDPLYEPDSLNNADDRLKSSYFGAVPFGVNVFDFESPGGTDVSKITVQINEVQVYRVNPSGGAGMLRCIDNTTMELK